MKLRRHQHIVYVLSILLAGYFNNTRRIYSLCLLLMQIILVSLSFQGFKQQALAVSTDPEHRFELALQLGELKIAYQLAVEAEVRECLIAFLNFPLL